MAKEKLPEMYFSRMRGAAPALGGFQPSLAEVIESANIIVLNSVVSTECIKLTIYLFIYLIIQEICNKNSYKRR